MCPSLDKHNYASCMHSQTQTHTHTHTHTHTNTHTHTHMRARTDPIDRTSNHARTPQLCSRQRRSSVTLGVLPTADAWSQTHGHLSKHCKRPSHSPRLFGSQPIRTFPHDPNTEVLLAAFSPHQGVPPRPPYASHMRPARASLLPRTHSNPQGGGAARSRGGYLYSKHQPRAPVRSGRPWNTVGAICWSRMLNM